jgi:pimeloyl-ACP methyl ester carboxylesterase
MDHVEERVERGAVSGHVAVRGLVHADIAAAVAALRGPEKLPVWLVGTSMGTVSAAAAAVSLGAGIDGLVLTSSITRPIRNGPNWLPEPGGIRDFALAQVGVPVFMLGHAGDGCWSTPPGDIPDLVRRFTGSRRAASRIVDGGLPAESEPCEALSAHGYFGIERHAVDAIVDGAVHPAVANLGVRPTFAGSTTTESRLEVHLLDFHGDLYGRELEVAFRKFLRPERKFADAGELTAQIAVDVAAARAALRG